jgi:hypothetical protein
MDYDLPRRAWVEKRSHPERTGFEDVSLGLELKQREKRKRLSVDC